MPIGDDDKITRDLNKATPGWKPLGTMNLASHHVPIRG